MVLEPVEKRPYSKPSLMCHGKVANVTAGGSNDKKENDKKAPPDGKS